jgi:tetratricopeptide (TPR) repeat protein
VVVVPTIAAVFALDSLRKRRRLRELAKGQHDSRQREAWELWQQGRYAEVAEVYQKIVRSVEDELGPFHAELVKHLACLGEALAKCGRVAAGTALLHRALAIAERATSAPDLAVGPLLSLGGLAFEERQFRRAGDLYERARAAAATDPRLRAIAEESAALVAFLATAVVVDRFGQEERASAAPVNVVLGARVLEGGVASEPLRRASRRP